MDSLKMKMLIMNVKNIPIEDNFKKVRKMEKEN